MTTETATHTGADGTPVRLWVGMCTAGDSPTPLQDALGDLAAARLTAAPASTVLLPSDHPHYAGVCAVTGEAFDVVRVLRRRAQVGWALLDADGSLLATGGPVHTSQARIAAAAHRREASAA